MTALGYAMGSEALQGWRIWRVLPFERLDGTRTVRLCAVGTYGIPKLWEPRRPIVAVCSSFTSGHEAPWVEHECGIWALKRQEDARRWMDSWMQTQGDPLGWACGQVSLWGRVIEHEQGWRAQYAYPYAITVESLDAGLAAAIRTEYAVDVDWNGADLYEAALTKRKANEAAEEKKRAAARAETKRLQRETDAAIARLGEIETRLRARATSSSTQTKRERQREEEAEKIRAMPPIPPLDDLSVDEVLKAVVTQVVGWHQAFAWDQSHAPAPFRRETTVEERMHEARLLDVPVDDVTECVLYARGEKPPFWAYHGRVERRGLKEARRVVRGAMREALDAGDLEYGLPFESRNGGGRRRGYWFITRRGLARVSRSAGSDIAPYYNNRNDEWHRHDVDLAQAVRLLRRNPRPPFVEEIDALIPMWMKERRAARRRGRSAYRAWLHDARATCQPAMLWFTDDEVEAAVRRTRKPVQQADIMAALAPADSPSERLKGEVAHLSQQLVRLHREGRLSRQKKGNTIWWEAAHAV